MSNLLGDFQRCGGNEGVDSLGFARARICSYLPSSSVISNQYGLLLIDEACKTNPINLQGLSSYVTRANGPRFKDSFALNRQKSETNEHFKITMFTTLVQTVRIFQDYSPSIELSGESGSIRSPP